MSTDRGANDATRSGAAVKQLRSARGLSQVALARMMGRTQQSVSGWERGHPSIATLLEIAEVLGATDDELRTFLPEITADRLARLRRDGALLPSATPPEAVDPEYWLAARSGAALPDDDRRVVIELVRALRAKNGLT